MEKVISTKEIIVFEKDKKSGQIMDVLCRKLVRADVVYPFIIDFDSPAGRLSTFSLPVRGIRMPNNAKAGEVAAKGTPCRGGREISL